MCVCERERERESGCVCERERERVCVCVCVKERFDVKIMHIFWIFVQPFSHDMDI